MRTLGAWRLLSAVALAGLVAGCGGNAMTSTPAGGTAQAPMGHVKNPKGMLVAPGRFGQIIAQGSHVAVHPMGPISPNKKSKGGCIYLGMNISATTYIYNGSTYALMGTIDAGGSGWGIGDSKKYAFVGTNNGSDSLLVHKQCDTSGNVVKTYTGSNTGGNPYGVWASEDNSAMSTNWPTNSIDQWDSSGNLMGTSPDTNMGEAYFVWYDSLDKKSAKKGEHERILLNGWSTNFYNAQTDTCTRTGFTLSCKTLIANSGGFPGGVIAHHDASSGKGQGSLQNVVVNDQFGYLNGYKCDLNAPSCTLDAQFYYASSPTKALDFTAIVFGGKCKDIWGANIFYTAGYTNIQGDGQQVTPDTIGSNSLGANTPPVVGDEPLGIAVSKPCKDT